MARLIDADKLIKEITIAQETLQTSDDKQWERNKKYFKGLAWAHKIVLEQPTIEGEPVMHAQWVDNHCTACGMTPIDDMLYEPLNITPPVLEYFMRRCPFCGAKMDKKSPENHKKYQEEETNKKAFK